MTRSVVVTGSGKGIGRGIAERLTADGWIVVGLERSAGSGTLEAGICAAVLIGDSRDFDAHRAAALLATERAPLAGWVNNAGITRTTALHNLDTDVVREVVETNGLGYMWGSAAAVETFTTQRTGGSIVNIGSIHGRSSYADHAAYEFTKGGIDALSRSIAVTYGRFGIRANTIAPGGVRTPHLETQIASAADPEAAERLLTDGPPMGRLGTVEEIAGATAFLLGSDSSYLSGESIAVDGGWTAAFGAPAPVPDPELLHRYGFTQ